MAPNLQCWVQVLVVACFGVLQFEAQIIVGQNPCISKTNCRECIQTPSCAWCYEPESTFKENFPRCYQPAGQLATYCKSNFTYFPSNAFRKVEEKSLTRTGTGGGFAAGGGSASAGASGAGHASGSAGGFAGSSSESHAEIVQVKPQKVKMRLRAGEFHSFHIQYAQAQDYPVDLYYLMDLSKSMEDDKDKLSVLGNLLAKTMQNITKDFQLGFGSFVDKRVMPYVSMVPANLEHPCPGCAPPYGYNHSMQLSKNHSIFSQMVTEAQVSGNLDAPEGGFDAIMQAVVCKNHIGWRDKARKLLVFSTDDGFHYAGDGKLGGIIQPNDGECHLQGNNYTHSTIQDYPSISQLNMKIKQNAINVIFAVTEKQYGVYEKLKGHIEGASSGILSEDSSNVVQLVKAQYEAISSTVEMRDNATHGVEIKYFSKCLNTYSDFENQTNTCDNFKVGQEIDFRLEVFLRKCPDDPKLFKQTIQVYPVGLSESVIIDLEMLCSCPCAHPGDHLDEDSLVCRDFGKYDCGICVCNDKRTGRHCECAQDGTDSNVATTGCRAHPTDPFDCSAKGVCICNQCVCELRQNTNETITGKFCECDNFSCYRFGGEICNGHGTCVCGNCECEEPWIGDACECYNATDTCYPSFKENPKVCDGHGKCVCGGCECDTIDTGKYTGRYCERCPNCTETCKDLRDCVLCQVFEKGKYSKEECVANCGFFTPVEVDAIQADENNNEFPCADYDEDDCRFLFAYKKLNTTHYHVKVQRKLECPPKVFLLGIILGVIAAVVLMGLAVLLLWKLLTTIHDRREFAKFEKERMMAKWDTGENPIYKQATSTFKNPTYAGKG